MGVSTRKWYEINAQRKFKKELKRKRKRKALKLNLHQKYNNKKHVIPKNLTKKEYVTLVAPQSLSICNNTNDSIRFLNRITEEFNKLKPVKLDLSKVSYLTIDAILYLLSLVRNYENKNIKFQISGNLPESKECKILLETSGFYKYTSFNRMKDFQNNNIITIEDGSKADPEISQKVCEFTKEKFNLTENITTSELYGMLMELQANTWEHAYKNDNNMLKYWYIFARYLEDRKIIECTFLDTGSGIPSTLNRRLLENKRDSKTQSKMLLSALNGENRSKTKLENRGIGLPTIKSLDQEYIQNLTVVSNSAFYNLKNQVQSESGLTESLEGTLFCWEINKEGVMNYGHNN